MISNNNIQGMTCCNMMFQYSCLGSVVYIKDIVTGKPVVFSDDKRSDEDVWRMFAAVGEHASGFYSAGIPGSVIFIGDKSETDDAIIYDWTYNIPALCFMSVSLFACYVSVINGKYVFVDVLTSKILEFESLNSNNCLFSKINKFFSDGTYADYVHTTGKYLVFSADIKEESSSTIRIDPEHVHLFSTYEHIYSIIYNNANQA